MVEVIVQEEWYSIEQCRENPRTLYVFGDNTEGVGTGGQAQIRYEPNSIGIPTKRTPSMSEDSFFSDLSIQGWLMAQAVTNVLAETISDKYDTIVFPKDGLGTGLSEMPTRSPVLYEYLNDKLYEHFGVRFEGIEYTVDDYSDKWWNNGVSKASD